MNSIIEIAKKRILIFSLVFFFLGIAFSYYFKLINSTSIKLPYSEHPLEEYFYPSSTKYFDSPFLNNSDVLDNCPCAGFEGRWFLYKPFKLPLPGTKKPGLYYQGKSADLILRCSNLFDSHIDNGNALIGYEHVKSEIWIDTQEENIVPKYFNSDLKKFTNKFDELIFENEKRFVKVADLSGFNVNMFEISGDSITRRAELTGRLSLDVNDELAQEYTIDIAYITKNILGDLIKTQCETIYNPYCDPNNLSDGSQLSFKCLYTIGEENLGLEGGYPYTKTFSFKRVKLDSRPIALYFDSQLNNYWVSSEFSGLYVLNSSLEYQSNLKYDPLNPTTLSSSSFDYGNKNNLIDFAKERVFVGTPNGLNVFNRSQKTFKRYIKQRSSSLLSNNIKSVLRFSNKELF